MSADRDEMQADLLDSLAGIEDDARLTPEQLADQAADDEAIQAEAPRPATLEQAEAEDAAAAEEYDDSPEPQAKPKLVPVGELVSERKRRQELERLLAEREARERAEAQAKEQQTAAQQQAAEAEKARQADPEPDYLDDPKGWTEWKIREQSRELESMKQQLGQTAQAQQMAQAERQIVNALQTSEAAMAQSAPDYYDALNHARQRAFQEFKAEAEIMGIQATDDQIAQYVAQQEKALAVNLVMRGIDPAKYVYEIAQRRYGYQGAAQAAQEPQAAPAPQARRPATEARAALRGLPSGDTGLQPMETAGNLPSEFAAAFSERFGRR